MSFHSVHLTSSLFKPEELDEKFYLLKLLQEAKATIVRMEEEAEDQAKLVALLQGKVQRQVQQVADLKAGSSDLAKWKAKVHPVLVICLTNFSLINSSNSFLKRTSQVFLDFFLTPLPPTSQHTKCGM
jgi:hypothetical protein